MHGDSLSESEVERITNHTMKYLSDYELDITKELISIAFSHASDAFSKLAKERILVLGFQLNFLKTSEIDTLLHEFKEKELEILTTDIKGKLDCKSYLIVNENDTSTIVKVFTGNTNTVTADIEFRNAILLELDNILTAAVVTQFSNFFKSFIYGDVPKHNTVQLHQLSDFFNKDVSSFDLILNINAKFISYETNMAPTFIWFMKQDFITAIKDLIKDKKHLSLVRSL